jgi:hypothetical protein
MEEACMQPGTNPEDIHTILSRFNQWTGKEPANGDGHAKALKGVDAGVREIPYEEAMRLMRSRRTRNAARAAATEPAVEAGPPAAVQATMPAETQAKAAPPEIDVRGVGKAEQRVPRKKTGAKKAPVAKNAKAEENKAAPRQQRHKLRQATRVESASFRQALAKSVGEAKPVGKPVRARQKGRNQRVSVRLSRAEEDRLQAWAARAGVTVSEYLRMRALETAAAPAKPRAGATAAAHHAKTAVQMAQETAKPAKSGLGDWIALMRNRFLASPARFAERA